MAASSSTATWAKLTDLPVDILQDIHLLALNPFLPVVNKHLRYSLAGSPAYIARYFVTLYESHGQRQLLDRALRHPIVNLEAAKELQSLWIRKHGSASAAPSDTGAAAVPDAGLLLPTDSVDHVSQTSGVKGAAVGQRERATPVISPPAMTLLPLQCTELPRRLFRAAPRPGQPAVDPFIRYLVDELRTPVDSKLGYPLARAALNGNTDLVRYLLSRGADASRNDSMAVQAAVQRGDLDMVKLLVESAAAKPGLQSPGKRKRGNGDPGADDAAAGGAPGTDSGHRAKRAKGAGGIVTEALVEQAMQRKLNHIVDYFVYEKGAMPRLRNIMAMGKADVRGASSPGKSRRRVERKRP